MHRAFFRPYHVFSVTSLVPFKGQGKARSDLHTRRLNPFFFPVVPKKGFGRLPKRKVCARIVQFAETFLAPKTPTEVILMGIFRMEASHFLCHHFGGEGGTGVDLLTWVGGRRGFLVSKVFFLGFPLGKLKKNWSQVENQGFAPDSGSEE